MLPSQNRRICEAGKTYKQLGLFTITRNSPFKMEAAGIALGVLGITGAFKDVIDLFLLFAASRDLGHDLMILLTRLDIEKFQLLQWAEQVGLLQHCGDKFLDDRLNNHDTQLSVAKLLAGIRLLLGGAAQLEQRYGLRKESLGSHAIAGQNTATTTINSFCMGRFEQQFRTLQIDIRMQNKSTPLWGRVRWAVHDRSKFKELISELAHLTARLREIVPPVVDARLCRAEVSCMEDLERIEELDDLKLVLEASDGHSKVIAESARELIDRRCQILQTLWFRKIDDRRGNVEAAHERTFRWALEPTNEDDRRWTSLPRWLSTSSGGPIYWVSGKAGSGKSTLMKFLYSSSLAKMYLSEWAGGDVCNIGDYFFWYLGSSEQNTQAGLARALLLQILSRHPSLVARALPNMWKEAGKAKDDMAPPSDAEMKHAFEVIADCRRLSHFCFFIDGLDEYSGSVREGIAFLRRLVSNPRIKVVVSSRPIPECVAEFGGLPSLRLQDLTYKDISAYVESTIGADDYMKRLLMKDSEGSRQILNDLVTKASGVFLWVVLACRSLREGFDAYDDVLELRQRVDELPRELGDMFQHMLGKIDRRHKDEALKLLRLCYEDQKARESGKIQSDGMYALDLAFSMGSHGQEALADIPFVSEVGREMLCGEIDGRLRSRCAGLLELAKRTRWSRGWGSCLCDAEDWVTGAVPPPADIARLPGTPVHNAIIEARVTFMHRTVFEFLNQAGIWRREPWGIKDSRFDVATSRSLGSLYLAVQSHRARQTGEQEQLFHFLREGASWGVHADRSFPASRDNFFWKVHQLLDRLEKVAWDSVDGTWTKYLLRLVHAHTHDRQGPHSHATLVLAIEFGAVNYIRSHPSLSTATRQGCLSCGCPPFLCSAMGPMMDRFSRPWLPRSLSGQRDNFTKKNCDVICTLLAAGCDPNHPISGSKLCEARMKITPWTLWLDELRAWYPREVQK